MKGIKNKKLETHEHIERYNGMKFHARAYQAKDFKNTNKYQVANGKFSAIH